MLVIFLVIMTFEKSFSFVNVSHNFSYYDISETFEFKKIKCLII